MSLVGKSKQSWLYAFAVWRWPARVSFARIIGLPAVGIFFLGLVGYGVLYRWNCGYYLGHEIDPVTMTIHTQAEPAVFSLVGAFGLDIALPPEQDNLRIDLLEVLFEPAYQVDRWWRPNHWARRSKSWDAATAKERADALSDLTDAQVYVLEKSTGRRLREEARY